MNGIFGNPPLEVPEWPTLPVPSGVGTTLPVPTAEVLRAPTPPGLQLPPRPGSEAPSTGAGFKFDPESLPMVLAALADLVSRATGKPTNQLGTIATLQGGRLAAQREERAGRTEERAVRAEERAVETANRQFALQVLDKQGEFIDKITDKAPQIAAMLETATPETKAKLIEGYRRRAEALGLDHSIIPDLLTQKDVASTVKEHAPYLRVFGPAFWNDAASVRATQGPAAFRKYIEEKAAPWIGMAAQNSVREVMNNLEATRGEGKVKFDEVAIAMQAMKPLEWQAIQAAPDRYEGFFALRGIKTPGLAAKVEEERALGPSKTAQKVAETRALLAPEIVEATAKKEAAIKLAVKTAEQQFAATTPLTASEAGTIRGQFLTQAKDFSDTIRAYQRVEDAVKDPSAAGDIAVLFGYMKMLDPGSVVRESEFATAANAAGVPEQIRNAWNRLMTGQRLGEAGAPTREDIADRSRRLVQGQLELHEQTERAFRGIAKKRKGEAEEVVPDIVGTDLRKRIKEGPRSAGAAKPGKVLEFVRDPKTGRLVPK